MENYAEIREKAWAAINAARQQNEKEQVKATVQSTDAAKPAKEKVYHFDSPKALMEHLMSQKNS